MNPERDKTNDSEWGSTAAPMPFDISSSFKLF